jgi:hypothetical protein
MSILLIPLWVFVACIYNGCSCTEVVFQIGVLAVLCHTHLINLYSLNNHRRAHLAYNIACCLFFYVFRFSYTRSSDGDMGAIQKLQTLLDLRQVQVTQFKTGTVLTTVKII